MAKTRDNNANDGPDLAESYADPASPPPIMLDKKPLTPKLGDGDLPCWQASSSLDGTPRYCSLNV